MSQVIPIQFAKEIQDLAMLAKAKRHLGGRSFPKKSANDLRNRQSKAGGTPPQTAPPPTAAQFRRSLSR